MMIRKELVEVLAGALYIAIGVWRVQRAGGFKKESWIGTRRILVPVFLCLAILVEPLVLGWKALKWMFAPVGSDEEW
jgi:hypothetical protein